MMIILLISRVSMRDSPFLLEIFCLRHSQLDRHTMKRAWRSQCHSGIREGPV